MKHVSHSRSRTVINGKRVSEMSEEEAKRNLRELARDFEHVKRERDNWRKKVKRYVGL